MVDLIANGDDDSDDDSDNVEPVNSYNEGSDDAWQFLPGKYTWEDIFRDPESYAERVAEFVAETYKDLGEPFDEESFVEGWLAAFHRWREGQEESEREADERAAAETDSD